MKRRKLSGIWRFLRQATDGNIWRAHCAGVGGRAARGVRSGAAPGSRRSPVPETPAPRTAIAIPRPCTEYRASDPARPAPGTGIPAL